MIALCAVLATTACGVGTEGKPRAVESAPEVELFDPCTIPDDAVASAGLDAGTKNPNVGPEYTLTDWKVCDWQGPTAAPWFYAGIYSGKSSVDELRSSGDYQDFREVAVGARTGLLHRRATATPELGCGIAFDVNGGIVMVDLETKITEEPRSDPCEVLTGIVEKLEGFLF